MSTAKQHHWYATGMKGIPWCVCAKCGLIKLRNEKTERKVRKACPGAPEDQA